MAVIGSHMLVGTSKFFHQKELSPVIALVGLPFSICILSVSICRNFGEGFSVPKVMHQNLSIFEWTGA